MLTDHHISVIKSTIPLLESAGPALTAHFYKRLFQHNPELQNIFNMSNQRNGRQGVALFEAVAAYAKNIENLAALTGAVERIAQKHTSFNVQPEHYQVVGHHLIETLRELAGDAFTAEVEESWTAAYTFLAGIFIGREGELYQERGQAEGGWIGTRDFIVSEKKEESELVTSFVLTPADGKAVLDYQPGQYIGLEVKPEAGEYLEIRQYSLSQKPNGVNYRISVKRETQENKDGVVSHHMHNQVKVGDSVKLYPPAGDFFYVERQRPVTLISGGVGVTPMQAMLQSLAGTGKTDVTYLHACNTPAQHTFAEEVAEIVAANQWQQHVWYLEGEGQHSGKMDLNAIRDELALEGDFYICGPTAFMAFIVEQLEALGVDRDRIHYEMFGPHATL